MKITKELSDIIQDSFIEAKKRKHEFVTPEHFLYCSLKYPTLKSIFKILKVDIKQLKEELKIFIETKIPAIDTQKEPEQSYQLQKLFEIAVTHIYNLKKEFISTEDLIVSIFNLQDSYATFFLQKFSLSKSVLLEIIKSDEFKKTRYPSEDDSSDSLNNFFDEDDDLNSKEDEKINKKNKITNFIVDLTEKAKLNELAPFIGRDDLIERVMEILCRKYKNNPLLVGEPGVGKTAIVEGLAQRIIENRVPHQLKGMKIYLLDLGSLISGTKFRGQFEERIKNILNTIKQEKNSILFIDEIHTIIGAGSTSNSSLDAASLIKPFLTSGQIRFIGSTSYDEYRKVFEKDRPLSRRFQKVDIPETSFDETVNILESIIHIFEDHHKVQYTKEAIISSVKLSQKYLKEKFLPDKAIDLIDESGAHARMFNANIKKKIIIDEKDIQNLVSKIAKVPVEMLSSNEKEVLSNLEEKLKGNIIGQDQAIKQVVDKILLARSGLKKEDKPVASFLFVGPSGVGKTELSKQLARFLNIPFLRYDMSEYQEKHTVSRLIGAPAGYVGYEEGGLLTNSIIKNPYSVLLLDEIEKAHPDIFNTLLQIMDYATLTDNNGRKADFRNVIIIMTSNAGTRYANKKQMGFNGTSLKNISIKEALEKFFSPEFRNRLDAIVLFNELGLEQIKDIVKLQLNEFSRTLLEKGIELKFDDELVSYIANISYTPEFGARQIERLIEEKIKNKFVTFLVFNRKENYRYKAEILYNKDKKDDPIDFIFNQIDKIKNDKKIKKKKIEKV
ncbi:MAG: ATP-dependent Clp protease ATP-binding subunit [Exilispira sp.]|jgi:ATP-dependent Clp protease ATP-binding subunit ClpA|nr:ATP-dependent Clp protease ATP-binding subunit [Exilispira sp.]